MAGTLGYRRGFSKCLLCGQEHEVVSVSSGVYGRASICPGHPVRLNRIGSTRVQKKEDSQVTIADGIRDI